MKGKEHPNVKINGYKRRTTVRYRASESATRVQSDKSVTETVLKRRYLQ